jgi:CelD/BcsL family acetyltransferase involved in cellulose biosynthesis
VAGPAALDALADEWAELQTRARPRLPFTTLRWLSVWWRHYSEQRLLIRDEFFVHELRDERGRLVAVAPLTLTARPGAGPLRARSLAFFGSDQNVTELRGMLCAPEDEARAVSSLLRYLQERKKDWDWFVWSGIRQGSEAHAILSQTPGFNWTHTLPDYVLPLPATWQEFRASRSRNIKESIRKCYNSLKRGGHDFRFRVVSEAGALPEALARFFVLHTIRANAPGLPSHADVFASERARAFLLALAREPGHLPRLRVFELEIAGRVVASRVGFLLDDELYLYFSGYDPEWGRLSVMTTVVVEAIKWAIEQHCRCVNLSPGDDISKTRWRATVERYESGVLVSPTERGRLMFGVLRELDNKSRTDTVLGRMLARARRNG